MMRWFLLLLSLAAVVFANGTHNTNDVYLLRVRDGLLENAAQESQFTKLLSQKYEVEVKKTYRMGALHLLHVLGRPGAIERVRELSEVVYVEPDTEVFAFQGCSSQPSPGSWGLDRIDQREALSYTDPLDPGAVYEWGENMGEQTNAYVADTGIAIEHPDFGGRATWAYTAEGITGTTDGNGHGTHCAGIVGSNTYGVAKQVNLHAVKVLSDFGSGSTSSVVDGLNWILSDHQQQPSGRSVASLSLGGSPNQAMDDAVSALVAGGVPVTVVAGASNNDACLLSPARVPEAVTVGSSDVSDVASSSGNWGSCIDLFAPGVTIQSTYLNNGTAVISGSSMAGAFVTGAIARYQSALSTPPTPAEVDAWLQAEATKDALTFNSPEQETSPNLLLFSNCTLV